MKKWIVSLLIVMLLVTIGVKQVQCPIQTQNKNIVQSVTDVKNKNDTMCVTNQEQESNYVIMQAVAYDLSIQCCGKSYSNPSRGITRDGYNLTNKHHNEAWTVASNKFPLGTKLKLEFPEGYEKYNGVYICRDTGNFDSNVLDIYMGDFGEKVNKNTIEFGRVDVKVLLIEESR